MHGELRFTWAYGRVPCGALGRVGGQVDFVVDAIRAAPHRTAQRARMKLMPAGDIRQIRDCYSRCCHHYGMDIPDGGPDRQLDADPVFGPALAGRQAPAAGTGVTGRRRGRGMARGWERHTMTTFTVYTVMVQEEQGWRQLVAPAQRPEGACQALADLIRDGNPWTSSRTRTTVICRMPCACGSKTTAS
jgi:hypothetical protein